MSDVYADFLDLLSPAAGGIQAGGWLFGDVLPAKAAAILEYREQHGPFLEPDGLHLSPGLDYTWTYDTGADNLLRAGDRLLVLVTADRQDYYVLQKAVFS